MVVSRNLPDSADRAAHALREKKLIIIPTDTIYGFSGIVPDSNDLIIRAKGRDEGKPFIQLIAEPSDLMRFTEDRINPDLLSLWPGAVTIIVRHKTGGTTAFRCPGDVWLREVLAKTGSPVYSTSVNRAGEPALRRIADIISAFGTVADLIVDDGDHETSSASTIIDTTGAQYRIIRQGAVTIPDKALVRPY